MSYAAFKMMHWATGIEHCAAGFITHSAADFSPRIPPVTEDDLDSDWPASNKPIGSVPNLITVASNILEVYTVRIQEESSSSLDYKAAAEPKRGGVLAGVSGASLELVCHYRFILFYLLYHVLNYASPAVMLFPVISFSLDNWVV